MIATSTLINELQLCTKRLTPNNDQESALCFYYEFNALMKAGSCILPKRWLIVRFSSEKLFSYLMPGSNHNNKVKPRFCAHLPHILFMRVS